MSSGKTKQFRYWRRLRTTRVTYLTFGGFEDKFRSKRARRPAFAQHFARESNSERELAQVESTVCFQRKLSSERVNRASVLSCGSSTKKTLADYQRITCEGSVSYA